jgi:hypothetical protein
VGLDRLRRALLLTGLVGCLVGCDEDKGPPERLLYGEAAVTFAPVPNSVITAGRVLRGTGLGRRLALCRPPEVPVDVAVVERIGASRRA